jgi:CheY-like chemotaxis protein
MDVPISFSRVLVVSGSSVFRELLRLTLDPHSGEVLVAADRREGRDQLARYSPLDVVICDVSLSNGDGFGLLDDVAALGEARPEVILVAGQPMAGEERRVLEKGAAGYLEKPITFRDIASLVKRRTGGEAQRALRRRPGGRACLLGVGDQIDLPDAGQPQILWYARDVSVTGAFLETESPLPVSAKLDLALEIGDVRIRVTATVVRVQEPSWGCGGGVGVSFLDYGDSAMETIQAFVTEGGADTY